MSRSATSIFVYAIYVFGLPQATEVWIRVAGMTVVFLSVFYFIAARNEYRAFASAESPICAVARFAASLVVIGEA